MPILYQLHAAYDGALVNDVLGSRVGSAVGISVGICVVSHVATAACSPYRA